MSSWTRGCHLWNSGWSCPPSGAGGQFALKMMEFLQDSKEFSEPHVADMSLGVWGVREMTPVLLLPLPCPSCRTVCLQVPFPCYFSPLAAFIGQQICLILPKILEFPLEAEGEEQLHPRVPPGLRMVLDSVGVVETPSPCPPFPLPRAAQMGSGWLPMGTECFGGSETLILPGFGNGIHWWEAASCH